MDSIHIFLLGLFSIVLYFIIMDQNVASVFFYTTKIVTVYFERQLWWFMNNPSNPVVKYIIWRRSLKMAKKIKQSLEKTNENR